jgi:hypothetical protein
MSLVQSILLGLAVCFYSVGMTQAAVINIAPFSGELSESFEEFNPGQISTGTIMGGFGLINGLFLYIYTSNPSQPWFWFGIDNTHAQTVDGVNGLAIEHNGTIQFNGPGVIKFGGYFDYNEGFPDVLKIQFWENLTTFWPLFQCLS